jgi:hypothetical protein
MIPHVNRTCDVILSDQIEAHRANVKEVIDDFRGQVEDYTSVFEAIVMMAPGRFRITFKGARKMEAAEHSGLTVRGFPVTFRPISKYTWVNVTRLSYGVPDAEITKALSGFGDIKKISSEIYSHIYTGVRHVLMEIRQPIPFRMRIAGHWCFVHHKGQKRLCFGCGQEGHNRSSCPAVSRPPAVVDATQGQNDLPDSGPMEGQENTQVEETMSNLLDTVSSEPSVTSGSLGSALTSVLPLAPSGARESPVASGSLPIQHPPIAPPRRKRRRSSKSSGKDRSRSPLRKDTRVESDDASSCEVPPATVRPEVEPPEGLPPEDVPLPEDEGPYIPSLTIGNPSIEGLSDLDITVDGSISDIGNELSDSLLTPLAQAGASSTSAAGPLNLFRPEANVASEETSFSQRPFPERGALSDDGSDSSF